MLNGNQSKPLAVESRVGRTLLVVHGAGDALPSLFPLLVAALQSAKSMESPDLIFSSTHETTVEGFDPEHVHNAVVLATGYSAGQLLETLGSGGLGPSTRNRIAGLVLVDAFVDAERLERLKWDLGSLLCASRPHA